MVDIEHAIRNGVHGWLTAPIPTLATYWTETYRPTYTVQKRAPERDDQVMAHALPMLGNLRLDEVKKSDCERYLNERRRAAHANPTRRTPGRVSEGTVQRERSFLHAVFQQAVEDGVLDKNPWRKIERVPYDVRDRLLTESEQAVLLARLSPRYQRFVVFLLGTGVRLEECRGIHPARDLKLDARLVRVTGKFGKTRDVPLPAELVPILTEQLNADGHLWPQNPQRLREVLANACREVQPSPAGTRPQYQRKAQTPIPHVSPHTLRHTFGWRWLKGGGDIYGLSKILGHESVAVTEKHYARLLNEDLRAKMDLVDLGLPKLATKGKVIRWKGHAQ
ncbi:MAG: tyrosine-type recombinase/integrase [Acidobacteria bacterium]|nr:tyrosine-type recombinase/integrase [Acidobacteriota bacterium]